MSLFYRVQKKLLSSYFIVLWLFFVIRLVASDRLAITSDASVRLLFNLPPEIRNYIVRVSNEEPYNQIAFETKLRAVCQTWNQAIPKIDVKVAFKRFSISPISFALLTGNIDEVADLNQKKGCSLMFEAGQKYRPIDYAIGKKSKQLLNALRFDWGCSLVSQDYKVKDVEGFWTTCAQPSYDDQFKHYLYQFSANQFLRHELFYELHNLKHEYVKKFGCDKNLQFFNFFFKVFIEKALFNAARNVHFDGIMAGALCDFLVALFKINLDMMLDGEGLTLLAAAIKYNNNNMVNFLLSKPNVLINQETAYGRPPLYYAIKHGNNHAILQLSKRPDIDWNWVDPKTGLNLKALLASYNSTQYLHG